VAFQANSYGTSLRCVPNYERSTIECGATGQSALDKLANFVYNQISWVGMSSVATRPGSCNGAPPLLLATWLELRFLSYLAWMPLLSWCIYKRAIWTRFGPNLDRFLTF
jgi:hypothetical protein